MSDVKTAVIAHLELLQEWGVPGFSRDAAWTRRVDARAAPGAPELTSAADTPIASRVEPAVAVASAAVTAKLPADQLVDIRDDIGDCTRCKLHTLGRRQIVFGVGNPRARLMFVGEAPGQDEDLQGVPFVGRAGQLLTKIIEAMGMTREDVYIANVIKCRPPGNRNPEPDEVATCEPFLFRQIDVIQPDVIVALGTFAAKALLRTNDPISRLRGRAFDYRGAKLIPTFHPAFLLRSPQFKKETWEDMKLAMAILKETAPAAAE